jgi:peptide/nickel transport system permease protein
VSGWAVRRVGQALLTFYLAATVAFFLMRITPGDPLAGLTEDRPLPPAAIAALRERYDLNRPLLAQYLGFLTGVTRGDLGGSIQHNGRPVLTLLEEHLPPTLLLGGAALCLNFLMGIAVGVYQASRPGSRADRLLTIVSLTTYAMPSFWLALVLAWAFGTRLHWLPVAFMLEPYLSDAPWLDRAVDALRHLVLPVLTLSLVTFGATARYQRAAMLDALALDAVRTARTKGVPEWQVVWRHAWRNSLGPMLALFGLWLPLLVGGSK